MKLRKVTPIILGAFLSQFGFALAQPAAPLQYTPGLFTAIASTGGGNELRVGYTFGKNNLNAIALHAGYRRLDFKRDTGDRNHPVLTDEDLTHFPVALSYTRLFQIRPAVFGNRLFWSASPFYGRDFGSQKIEGQTHNSKGWGAGIASGAEWRFNNTLALGGSVTVFLYGKQSWENWPASDDVTSYAFFNSSSVYLSYKF